MLFTTLAFVLASVGQGPPDWYEPFPAHKVIGNVYYVGSKDLATFLITTPKGHILINSGLEHTVPLIQKSVTSLGFKMSDVKILLASHAHVKKGQANAFVNPEGYKEYVTQKERAFRKTLAVQQGQAELEKTGQGTPPAVGHASSAPQVEINNGVLKAHVYLPDAQNGFYRGTRFDWSGVIGSLEYQGHRYYGRWFTKTDPTVNDFLYQGAEIVAGPCSAITGPVEEFSTDDQALGYEEAKPDGTFLKIGVGVLRKPHAGGRYNRFRLYDMVDPGTWKVQTTGNGIAFTHEVVDPSSGYGYRYQKTIQLAQGRPDMVIDHTLKNTGKRTLASSVYNHNFLVLDGQPPGPDFVLKLPFELKTTRASNHALAEVRGNQIVYLRALRERETVFLPLQGFGPTAADYRFTIENKKTGAGLRITGDRPLSKLVLWSIRSVLSLEPFLAMVIEPGQEFTWRYTYTYYLIDGNEK